MSDQDLSDIQKRALALVQDPTRHDPEAFKFIMGSTADRITELQDSVETHLKMVTSMCRHLSRHAPECGVAAALLAALRANGVTPVVYEEIALPADFKAYTPEFQWQPTGVFFRVLEMPRRNVAVKPMGPFPDEGSATIAARQALTDQGLDVARFFVGEDLAKELLRVAGLDAEDLVKAATAAATRSPSGSQLH